MTARARRMLLAFACCAFAGEVLAQDESAGPVPNEVAVSDEVAVPDEAAVPGDVPVHEVAVPDQSEEARLHFQRGMQALGQNRFHDAARELSRSHSLLPNVANAFNLAVALLRIARVHEAIALFRNLQAERFGDIEGPQHAAIQARLEEAERALAFVHVLVEGVPHARVLVDDVEVGRSRGAEPLIVQVDPGSRRVEAVAPEMQRAATTFTAESGETHRVRLAPAFLERPADEANAPNYRRRRVLWVSLSLVVLGGATLAIVLSQRGAHDPIIDPVTGIGETLRAPSGFSF